MAGCLHLSTAPHYTGLWSGDNPGYGSFHNPGHKLLGKLFQKGGAAHANMLDTILSNSRTTNPQ